MSDKRTQLLEAAIDLFSKEGFWNTPTSRIARHAQVATGTLFNYFPSKEALIDEVYVELKQELFYTLIKDFSESDNIREVFQQVWSGFVRWGVANPVRFLLLEQLRLSDLVSEATREKIMEQFKPFLDLIEQGQRAGTLADVDMDYMTSLITAHIETSVKYAVDNGIKGKKLDAFCDKGFATLWQGIAP